MGSLTETYRGTWPEIIAAINAREEKGMSGGFPLRVHQIINTGQYTVTPSVVVVYHYG